MGLSGSELAAIPVALVDAVVVVRLGELDGVGEGAQARAPRNRKGAVGEMIFTVPKHNASVARRGARPDELSGV